MVRCLECNREFANMNSLSRHIGRHMTQEEYFDKYLRTSEQEGKCIICGKPTKFRNFGYSKCCSNSCSNIWINQNRTEEERQAINEKLSKAHLSEETKEKTRQTNIEKYGVPYTTQNQDVQEKRRQTCQEKYGVDCSFQAEEVKQKIQDAIYEHFGEEGLKAKEVRDKSKATCQEKYGVDTPGQAEEVKQKIKETNLRNRGVEYAFQSEDVKAKIKQTKKERYNDENYTNVEKAKQTFIDHFGVDNPQKNQEIRKKTFNTMKEKYNCEYPLQNEEIKNKMFETLWENGGLHRLEKRCYDKLLEKYPDAVREYKSDKYPFKCDFYIPSEDLYIELNIYWSHGGHYFNENDPQDIELLKYWKSKNNETYEYAIHVWTETDLKKKRCAEDNRLNYLVFWTEEDFIDWLK